MYLTFLIVFILGFFVDVYAYFQGYTISYTHLFATDLLIVLYSLIEYLEERE